MKLVLGLAVSAALCSAAAAEETAAPAPQPAPAVAASSPEVAAKIGVAKAGSLVMIQIVDDLSSKTAVQGDLFPISLVWPITSDDGVLVPAGTRGVGQVVSVSKAGAFGKAGELVLAARYLEFNGQKIPLKAFKLGGSGDNNSNKIAVASFIAPLPIAIAALAVHGGDIQIPAGAVASAKLSADVTLPLTGPLPASGSSPSDSTPASNASAEGHQ